MSKAAPPNALARFSAIHAEIARAETVEDLAGLDAFLRTFAEYVRAHNIKLAEQNAIVRARLDLARKAGALLLAVPEGIRGEWSKGLRQAVPHNGEPVSRQHAIEQAGLTKGTAHRWMTLARAWADDDEWHERLSKGGELRFSRVIGEAESILRRQEPEPEQPRITSIVESLGALIVEGKTFGTVYADPPWPYQNQGTRAATGNHYRTVSMSLDALCAMPVEQVAAPDAHLHLWTTNAFLFDARAVMEAWGFTYKSCFVWVKPKMGIGNYWRVSHEFLLLGVRGSAPFRDRAQMSWREWPRGSHSAKPERMYEIIEVTSPGPYLEMFARREREGWTSLGDEIERDLFSKRVAS